ncbi:MAG: aminoacyl-tRNA hydrolase [Oleispira sp.]|nr:aminoacyl-tRNA hydrolase [Oleispira sp.]
MSKIKLIVGLGNPGSEYETTRHNAGAWFITEIARAYNIILKADKKFFGISGQGRINGQDIWLLFPTTYMNKSGQAVQALANFYKITAEEILVAHDELDLPSGTARLKNGGGHGGQNGLRDIISCLGNNKNFHRLRIGIGHPGDKSRVTGHVLGHPSANEKIQMDATIDEAGRVLPDAIAGDWGKAMNRLHSFKA